MYTVIEYDYWGDSELLEFDSLTEVGDKYQIDDINECLEDDADFVSNLDNTSEWQSYAPQRITIFQMKGGKRGKQIAEVSLCGEY